MTLLNGAEIVLDTMEPAKQAKIVQVKCPKKAPKIIPQTF